MNTKGRCLCGAAKFRTSIASKNFGACHCSMCRQWGGGPLMAVTLNSPLEFENEAAVGVYASSDWAERGFCKTCGTHLFYRLKDGRYQCVPLDTLEDKSGFEFATQIYTDSKPEYYAFANQTAMMTEAEVLEAFGGDA